MFWSYDKDKENEIYITQAGKNIYNVCT